MKTFISLPYVDIPASDVCNISDMAKSALSKSGYTEIISPRDVYVGRNATFSDKLTAYIRAMLYCDVVYFAKGWEQAPECKAMHYVAKEINTLRINKHIIPLKIIYA